MGGAGSHVRRGRLRPDAALRRDGRQALSAGRRGTFRPGALRRCRPRTRPAFRLRLPAQRTFSVASPISARTRLMIQNRMTICGSAQPFFSKWWWIGAIRNTRRPVRLK